jgi:SAM-dependent methyltransferase
MSVATLDERESPNRKLMRDEPELDESKRDEPARDEPARDEPARDEPARDEPAPFAERARSFGSIAEHYDRFRPAPPAEAVEWVLGDARTTALDLGAGTGALTGRLVPVVPHVVAAEPDPEMRAVLHKNLPDVPLVAATAEALPFGSDSFDAVLASSAWHWMDPERAPLEVGRVLESNGVLGLLWNGADRSDDWTDALLGPGLPTASLDPRPGQVERHTPEFGDGAPFHGLESRTVRWRMNFSVDELVGLMGSYSRVFTLPEEARDKALSRVRDEAGKRVAMTGASTVELPMRCQCWRITRD